MSKMLMDSYFLLKRNKIKAAVALRFHKVKNVMKVKDALTALVSQVHLKHSIQNNLLLNNTTI